MLEKVPQDPLVQTHININSFRVRENAVNKASHVDKAYEKIINVVFGLVGFFACLALLGLDVIGVLTGLSALLVSFGFMIGSGTSQLFEGIMMVLSRQPYDIGDRIAIVSLLCGWPWNLIA